jgi:predicted amidohydrolase
LTRRSGAVVHAPDAEAQFVDALCTVRAFEQEIVLVCANAAAPLRPRQGVGALLGHSQVTLPFKDALQRCDHNREAMLVQSVDAAILADAETAYAIRQDLKKGLSLNA